MPNWKKFFSFVDENGEWKVGKIIRAALLGIAILVTAYDAYVVIGAEEVGVPVTLGTTGNKPAYGFTPKLPFVTHYVRYKKVLKRFTITDSTYTKDLQDARVVFTITYKIVANNSCGLYKEAGRNYEETMIEPSVPDALKAVFGRWTATELVANRPKVAKEIADYLKDVLPGEFLSNITVKLDDIKYSDAFEKGIESKVLEEQEAQKSKNRTVRIEEEGKQKVIQAKAIADANVAEAEGKAKAMDIEGEAIRRNTQYLDLKKVDAQIEMAKSAQNWQTVIMSEGQAGALLNIPTK